MCLYKKNTYLGSFSSVETILKLCIITKERSEFIIFHSLYFTREERRLEDVERRRQVTNIKR